MKNIFILSACFCSVSVFSQQIIRGIVVDQSTMTPLKGITVALMNIDTAAVTDGKGEFNLTVSGAEKELILSGGGYEKKRVKFNLPLSENLMIPLIPKITEIKEITLATGYQKISKDRATGSFSTVNRELLNKEVTTNIMERLSAVSNGVVIDRAVTGSPQIMVRGISTLQGPRNPLIILDDFPYEGDLNNINPDIVENITVLKDAAASSIWGARAANGVIVITTKKPNASQPLKAEFTANTTLSARPDLSNIRQISSADFIAVEKQLFAQGFYDSDLNAPNHPVLTPVVDLLNQQQNGIITPEYAQQQIAMLEKIDVRDQYRRYMYQPSQKLQYALNLSEGGSKYSWFAGIGYDRNSGSLGETFERKNVRLQNTWKLTDHLTASAEMLYANTTEKSGRSAYSTVSMSGNWKIPYMQFADQAGNPLVVFSTYNQRYKESLSGKGLVDWNYYPLTDWMHSTSESSNDELILNASLQYKILKGLTADVKYQYQRGTGISRALSDADSYYARNYTNTFAQENEEGLLTFKVPKGGILDQMNSRSEINNLRTQANYTYSSSRHSIAAIAGAETRATDIRYEENRYYGYNPKTQSAVSVDYTQSYPTFVTGDMDFIQPGQVMKEKKICFVSLYANATYTYNKKYTVTGSIRRDASNLFGLKTNDQWNPFWSTGLAWKLSDENFYPFPFLPTLKLRGSYGFNGNIDPAMVAVTTIVYDTSPSIYTGTGMARIDQYYNPNLRWETSRMMNVAVDFASQNNRIAGSVDFFTKKGSNLFGTAPLDYTTGVTTLLWNVAGMQGKGVDVELKTGNLITGNFKWNTVLNLSTYRDEVTNYYRANSFASNYVSANGASLPISGIEGLPVYSMFAYRWAGLDPETGDPRGYLNGEISKDYTAITASETGIEDLQYFGSALPTTYGSFINTLSFKDFSLDVGLTYKLGYWFRRSSINYTNLIVSRNGHSDFGQRWQQAGDEIRTNIPSFTGTADSSRDAFYSGSAVLVEKGDHVRLQFLNLNYSLNGDRWKNLPFRQAQLYASVSNLGILWRANKQGLDPDFSFGNAALRPVTTYTIGFRAHF